MPRQRILTPQKVAKALTVNKGMVYLTARMLRCAVSTIYNYVNEFPECKAAKELAEGEVLDTAEVRLALAVQRGEPWAIQFVLKTKGKKRGYVERVDTTSLNIDLTQLTDDQLERIARGEDVTTVIGSTGSS